VFDIQANFVPKDPFSFAPFSAAPPAACIRRQEVIQFPGSSHPCAIFHRSRQFKFFQGWFGKYRIDASTAACVIPRLKIITAMLFVR
jgi:hypothetical protein